MSRIKGGCLPAAPSWCDVVESSHHVLLQKTLLGSVLSACQLTCVDSSVSACPLALPCYLMFVWCCESEETTWAKMTCKHINGRVSIISCWIKQETVIDPQTWQNKGVVQKLLRLRGLQKLVLSYLHGTRRNISCTLRFSSNQMFVLYITVSVRYLTVIRLVYGEWYDVSSKRQAGSLYLGIIEWHPWLSIIYTFTQLVIVFSSLQFLPANAINKLFLLLIAIDVADWSFLLTIIASINFFSQLFWVPYHCSGDPLFWICPTAAIPNINPLALKAHCSKNRHSSCCS